MDSIIENALLSFKRNQFKMVYNVTLNPIRTRERGGIHPHPTVFCLPTALLGTQCKKMFILFIHRVNKPYLNYFLDLIQLLKFFGIPFVWQYFFLLHIWSAGYQNRVKGCVESISKEIFGKYSKMKILVLIFF